MIKNLKVLALILALSPLLLGCPQANTLKTSPKKEVRDELIIEIQDQIKEFKLRYNITNDTMIPEISRFDPAALALLMRPKQICKITRSSKTSITSDFYRICI